MLFVEAVRRCIDTLPADEKTCLSGLRNARSLLRSQPTRVSPTREAPRSRGSPNSFARIPIRRNHT